MDKQKLIILSGPTAAGKSALSLSLAGRCGMEIISADSVQVYRGMDIGSAKLSLSEREGIPHYLIDILDPMEEFNVASFCEEGKKAIERIVSRGKLPLIVGGTGFYIRALLYDVDFSAPGADPVLRSCLEEEAEREGKEALHARLKALDPASAEAIPPGNVKRVIRALEYALLTGGKISEHNALMRSREASYDFSYFVLTLPREELYRRINLRVDKMMEAGLLDEVRSLKEAGCTPGMTSMQSLGYRQLLRYLNGERSLPEAVEDIKKETRHFAKRQMTWYRRERDVIFIDKNDFSSDGEILEKIMSVAGLKEIS
ncbi:MAG: tRNA (adenosine(37)-N6)-dimethylallyltransferase MiaA [Lachnospiraceae bacterium]|nr:tRNA (adenosine(37)-N6)-dimethylallyltransferase MiaA [Lachnospiraceae bacterium]